MRKCQKRRDYRLRKRKFKKQTKEKDEIRKTLKKDDNSVSNLLNAKKGEFEEMKPI